MKKSIITLVLVTFLVYPVSAMAFTAPAVPESAEQFMPDSQESFGQGLLYILKSAISTLRPEISQACGVCLSIIVVVLLISILSNLAEQASNAIRLTGAVVIGILLLQHLLARDRWNRHFA